MLTIIQLAIGLYIEGVMLDPNVTTHALDDLRLHRDAELAQTVVFGSLNAVMAAVAYTQLRREKEGATAAELAAVFA